MVGLCGMCQSNAPVENEVIPGAHGFLEFVMSDGDVKMAYGWVLQFHEFCGESCSGGGNKPEVVFEEE